MRKAAAKGELTRATFNLEFDKIKDELDKTNASYDVETMHGVHTRPQKRWEKKIKKQLKELKEFSGDVMICLLAR